MLLKRVPLRQIVSTQDGGGEFRYLLREERQERVGQAFDVTEKHDGRIPSHCHTAGRNMHEHQYNVNSEHDVETTFREWQMCAAIKDVSGETADGEFCGEKSQVAVFENAGHEAVAFSSDAELDPE